MKAEFLRIGHRGARAYAPENTIKSFAKALELGVNAIEFDVRQTKDGQLIVMHDDKVDRTTNGKGLVQDLSLNEIKELTAGDGERVPTFGEALDFIDGKVDRILIELKETGSEAAVLDEITEKGLTGRAIIISFHEEALQKVRELNQKIATGFLYVQHKDPIGTANALKVQYLMPLYRFTHTSFIKKAQEKDFKIGVWTINDAKEVADFIKKGVDGIASDKPDILKVVL